MTTGKSEEDEAVQEAQAQAWEFLSLLRQAQAAGNALGLHVASSLQDNRGAQGALKQWDAVNAQILKAGPMTTGKSACHYCGSTVDLGRYGTDENGGWVCEQCFEAYVDKLKSEGVPHRYDAATFHFLDELDPGHRSRAPIATYKLS